MTIGEERRQEGISVALGGGAGHGDQEGWDTDKLGEHHRIIVTADDGLEG